MEALLTLLMGPWTTYILWVLGSQGATRFGALRRAVPGVSSRLLTLRLRLLEQEGVIRRSVEPSTPPRVSYALTARGFELMAALEALNAVARSWYPDRAGSAQERPVLTQESEQGQQRQPQNRAVLALNAVEQVNA
jgi:DNA-binding HxlR family transcriptional regulator